MRSERIQQLEEVHELAFSDIFGCLKIIHERHHGCDARVEFHFLDIRGDLLDRLVELALKTRIVLLGKVLRHSEDSLQEALAAAHGALIPRGGSAVITHKEDVCAERIRTELLDDVERIDDIAERLAHLRAVSSEDHALRGSLCIRFVRRHCTDIVEEVMPESGVDQMACDVLHTSVVPVNRQPVFELIGICKCLVIVRIDIAQEVPG